VQKGFTTNIKTARRMVDRLRPEVWDALEEVIKEHPVLLNRAPTLHRLGIQAFEPKLVDGKAIQIHPLVCPSFNADFDGDQMAVHVPLFPAAQAEARILMLSSNNLFSPRDGAPAMTPSYDMVLGIYHLTIQMKNSKVISQLTDEEKQALRLFANPTEAINAYHMDQIAMHDLIRVRYTHHDGTTERLVTTPGRLLFNEIVPPELGFVNQPVDKKGLTGLIVRCHAEVGAERCVQFLDAIKAMGFKYGTQSGISISMADVKVTSQRDEIVQRTETAVRRVNTAYNDDPLSMTAQERERRVLNAWVKAAEDVGSSVLNAMDKFNPFYMMAISQARGSTKQIQQIVGMRGLMQDPSGRLIEDLPVKSNFREGLNLHEYFVSTHGTRKGLADTALRTADAGYLTRRLVDVSQDVIIRADDCGTSDGITVREVYESDERHHPNERVLLGRRLADAIKHPQTGAVLYERDTYINQTVLDDIRSMEWPSTFRVRIHMPLEPLADRLVGRTAQEDVAHPETGEMLVEAGTEIEREVAERIEKSGIREVKIRSILTCKLGHGVCAACYGHDLATGHRVETGEASASSRRSRLANPARS
jgi:DNA-directed RNA polymerase subunit beta'